jgi:hypothetical protein
MCGVSIKYSYINRIENNYFLRNALNAHFDGIISMRTKRIIGIEIFGIDQEFFQK